MKLIIAIVQDEDSSRLLTSLMNKGFGVTKLATTGGFLKAGNTTLLIGVEDEKVQEAIEAIESVCKSRKQLTTAHTSASGVSSSGSTRRCWRWMSRQALIRMRMNQALKQLSSRRPFSLRHARNTASWIASSRSASAVSCARHTR